MPPLAGVTQTVDRRERATVAEIPPLGWLGAVRMGGAQVVIRRRILGVEVVEPEPERSLHRFESLIPALGPGEYLYLRVFQDDGGVAWSSPFFASEPSSD